MAPNKNSNPIEYVVRWIEKNRLIIERKNILDQINAINVMNGEVDKIENDFILRRKQTIVEGLEICKKA